ncbi:MAG TPA: thiamine pyrophosphate-binding protein [Steroidobacteraceae bacterium]|nr:thiamine pyrophosphate-binding protein [Steroidobacteraceae bacterium]
MSDAGRPSLRTGGRILVDELAVHGVDHAFCVPGESYLSVLDALYESPISLTVCRQEGGAAMMAEAYGKLTGRPGICMVTRGPGATNACPGLHIAHHDSTPMILLIGQVERSMRGREAFQEIDYRAFLGPLTKWVDEIDDPSRIPEFMSRAFHAATSGRPGPVALALPEDMLTQRASVPAGKRYQLIESAPVPEDFARFQELLARAERPLVVLGGSRWDQASVDRIGRFAEAFSLPVAVSFRRQDLFPSTHSHFIGDLGVGTNPRLLEYAGQCDFILLIGGRLSELTSQGYTLLSIPCPTQTLVHVHPGSEEFGKTYRPEIAFNMSPHSFSCAVSPLRTARDGARMSRVELGRRIYEDWSRRPGAVPGDFNLGQALCALREELPDDAVICNGAGNYAIWVHRYLDYRRFGTQLAPTAGSMGYGVPAAVAAKRLHPDRMVVAFAGDGCFLMNGQEFATAIRYELPIIVVVIDNAMFGTIRMHQETHYPGRVIGTGLSNPDFAAYARAFGGHGELVTTTSEFMPAFRNAVASGVPSIVHCMTDPDAITPTRSLSRIRGDAIEAAKGRG